MSKLNVRLASVRTTESVFLAEYDEWKEDRARVIEDAEVEYDWANYAHYQAHCEWAESESPVFSTEDNKLWGWREASRIALNAAREELREVYIESGINPDEMDRTARGGDGTRIRRGFHLDAPSFGPGFFGWNYESLDAAVDAATELGYDLLDEQFDHSWFGCDGFITKSSIQIDEEPLSAYVIVTHEVMLFDGKGWKEGTKRTVTRSITIEPSYFRA